MSNYWLTNQFFNIILMIILGSILAVGWFKTRSKMSVKGSSWRFMGLGGTYPPPKQKTP